MTICILTPRYPFPENGGDVLRINNIARYLKSQGHRLLLLSLTETTQVAPPAETLYDEIVTVPLQKWRSYLNALRYLLLGKTIQCGYYHSASYMRQLRRIHETQRPDLYISHLLRMTPYLSRLGVEQQSIVEMTDALSKTYTLASQSKGNLLMKFVYRLEQKRIQRYEQQVIRRFSKVVLVSQSDIDYLQRVGNHHAPLAFHTNGVECASVLPASYNPLKICFIGNMRTLQNQDAVFHFVQDIFPLILQKIPAAKFYIVGAQPSAKVQALASDNIIVTGFVDDLHAAVTDACLAVAPVRVAAGIQNKVLVAMGYGLPVVMTPTIAQAIPEVQDGVNAHVCADAGQFAQTCVRLMTDAAYRNAMAVAGHDMVVHAYSWNEKLAGYEKLTHREKL